MITLILTIFILLTIVMPKEPSEGVLSNKFQAFRSYLSSVFDDSYIRVTAFAGWIIILLVMINRINRIP